MVRESSNVSLCLVQNRLHIGADDVQPLGLDAGDFADAVKAYMGSNAMDIGKVMAEGFVNANSSATTIVQNNALGEQMADMNNRLGNLEVMTADFFLNMQTTVENNAKMTKNSNQMVELSRETNNLLKNL